MKKILFFILFIHFSIVLGKGEVEVVLKDKVVVPGPVVTLGEISDIKCDDEGLKKSLSEVEILNSPRPLKIRIIKRVYVENRLKLNRLIDKVKILGSEKVVISTDVKEVKEEEILNFVREYLDEKLFYKPENRDIRITRKIRNIFAPSRELHLKIIERRIGMMKGSFHVNVGIYNGEALYRSIIVPVEVRTFEDVVTAKDRILGGSVIKRELLSLERKETTTFGNDVIYSIEDAEGKRSKITIRKGEIIKGNVIDEIPVVERGEHVNISVHKGNVVVTSRGKALQDGYVGELIRVLNLSSEENITAEVNGKSSVIIR